MEEADELDDFPGFTEYRVRSFHGLFDLIEIPSIPATFIGEWEISCGFPIGVSFIIVSSYLLAVFSMLPRLKTTGSVIFFPLTILAFLFLYSYYRIIRDGPGYFPFYYPLSHREGDGEDVGLLEHDCGSPSGIISRREQDTWARKQKRPNRCIVSATARRIVIRPDHFCDWTQTWIGKRNYKFFLLFNTWGFIYICLFLVVAFAASIIETNGNQSPIIGVYFIYIFTAFLFVVFTGLFMCSHCSQMCSNVTSWEDWNHVPPDRYDEGCVRNTEDVCGSARQWYLWPCPVSPWTDMSNEELISGYTVDYGRIVGDESD